MQAQKRKTTADTVDGRDENINPKRAKQYRKKGKHHRNHSLVLTPQQEYKMSTLANTADDHPVKKEYCHLSPFEVFHPALFDAEDVESTKVKTTEHEMVVTMKVPGFTREDLQIKVTNDRILSVHGAHNVKPKPDPDSESSIPVENTFKKVLSLPPGAMMRGIKAECNDGVLTISIPRQPDCLTIPIL